MSLSALEPKDVAVDLKLPIVIIDEFSDEVIRASGILDLASGDISDVKHENYDVAARGPRPKARTTNSPAASCPTAARKSSSGSRSTC